MEPRDARTAIDAAERAAASGDFASAEAHLREAAAFQEQELGSSHPDLANTLNNLGIVCENAGKLDDAKAFYKRASEMAAATLPADHPFVATSRRNFDDFTRARRSELSPEELEQAFDLGLEAFPDASASPATTPAPVPDEIRPVEVSQGAPPPPPAVKAAPRPERATRQAAVPPAKASPASPPAHVRLPETPPPPAQSASRRTALAAVGVVLLLAVLFLWMRPGSGVGSATETPAATASSTQPDVPAESTTPPAPSESNPPPAPAARDETPVPTAPEPPPDAPAEPEPTPAPATRNGSPGAPTLAIAEVCGTFSTSSGAWTCDPIGAEAAPGRLAFYTRVRSARNTTVVHRWYQDDRLVQTVTLQIGANSGAGYRTYSRQTVADDGSRWRVEARSADGALLHEERFVVR